MKILEITAFSAGICGVWTRVKAECELLARKHEVHVFSSNIKRGTGKKEIAPKYEEINKVKIHRFPTTFNIGKNTYFWNFEKEALKIKPDVIITHAYRQYYSTLALKVAKKLNIPCFLVTHAPFVNIKVRGHLLSLVSYIYDIFIGRKILNSYDKVIAITKWEIPYLLQLGLNKNKIAYIPNGVPEEFFKTKIREKAKKEKTILFLGRIAPIKNIETLIRAANILKNKGINFNFRLVGPIEKEYNIALDRLIKNNRLTNIKFLGPVYNMKEKIEIIHNVDIFVLPSKREGMPQALLEAMALGKLAISSATDGAKEIIKDGKNGFLFEIENEKQLAEKLTFCIESFEKLKEIRRNAKKTAEQFRWSKLIKKIEKIYYCKK